MALWGISTSSETAANNYAIPKFQKETDRNTSPWNTFADVRGWIQRRYKTKENSGISTRYFDEVLVPVTGINTTNIGGTIGIGTAGPVAVFFEDPNQASPISFGGGGTTGVIAGVSGSGGSGIVIIRYQVGQQSVKATGGTVSYAGGKTIHTFTNSGTFTVTSPSLTSVETLVIGGGGGGGSCLGGDG